MFKIILLICAVFLSSQIKIHTFKIKKNSIEIKSNLTSLTRSLSADYRSNGEFRYSIESFKYEFSKLNKKLNTNVFNEIIRVNYICFYSKMRSDSIGSVEVEEWIFNNSSNAQKAFSKFHKYKRMRFYPPPLAPMNWLIYLKDERVYVLSNDNFHRYPTQQSQYSKWIIDNLFDGKATEIIEIHK
jgi:hypothetical protein